MMTPEEIQKMVERVREQIKRTDACAGHVFEKVSSGRGNIPTSRCKACGWEPRTGERKAYEQGLKHGREKA